MTSNILKNLNAQFLSSIIFLTRKQLKGSVEKENLLFSQEIYYPFFSLVDLFLFLIFWNYIGSYLDPDPWNKFRIQQDDANPSDPNPQLWSVHYLQAPSLSCSTISAPWAPTTCTPGPSWDHRLRSSSKESL